MKDKLERLTTLAESNPALLDRLLLVAEPAPVTQLVSPDDAYALFAPLLEGRGAEALAVAALDRKHRVLATEVLTQGNHQFTIVDPRQIYRWALQQGRVGAHAILIAHNHPSGDPTPSRQDINVTKRVAEAGKVLGLPLLDHLVVAGGRYESLANLGHIQQSTTPVGTTL